MNLSFCLVDLSISGRPFNMFRYFSAPEIMNDKSLSLVTKSMCHPSIFLNGPCWRKVMAKNLGGTGAHCGVATTLSQREFVCGLGWSHDIGLYPHRRGMWMGRGSK